MTIKRKDPYLGFRFKIEIEGLIIGGFSEVSGLQSETQVEDFREGGLNDRVHRLPKETKYPNLILKRGLTDSESLWKWHKNVVSGRFERKTVHVVLLDGEGEDAWRWSFEQAYPVKWGGVELKSDSNSVAFESVELAYEGFTRY